MAPPPTATEHDTADEVPLSGGRLTAGVVRVGDTVRRPAHDRSAFTEALLDHLERERFAGAPRFLGRDEQGRDVLSFVHGDVPVHWQRFADEAVHAAGGLLRAFHDATRGSALCAGRPVVCHHDAGPHNMVFRAGLPVALIDFDLAEPGDPLEDVAYAAWAWCLSDRPARTLDDQAAQLGVLVEGYGLDRAGRAGLIDAVLERYTRNIGFWRERGAAGLSPADRVDDIVGWTARMRAFTELHRVELSSAL
ncbi:MAG: phosphotransferase [Myxococcota bacterium]